jgi:preprotein translocase subunit SecE
MASKATLVNGEERPAKRQGTNPVSNVLGNAIKPWSDFSRFLTDVRAEMRKVVAPSRKEVENTTFVVLIAVFFFGVFFFVVDSIFQFGLHKLLGRLGGF